MATRGSTHGQASGASLLLQGGWGPQNHLIGGPTTPSQDGGRFLHQGPVPQTALGQRGLAPGGQLQSRLARVDGGVDP